MKKYIFFLTILLFLITHSKAQTSVYHAFPIHNAVWVNQYYDDLHNPTNQFYDNIMQGDTTIGAKTYKTIFESSGYYEGALREENKIIYVLFADSISEVVIYNFNLSVGDSILNYFYFGDTVVVNGIDSIDASDGYHKALLVEGTSGGGSLWIEGMGSGAGLFSPLSFASLSGGYALVCFEGDSITFPYPYNQCLTGISEENNSVLSFSLFPNPATNELTIHTSFSGATTVSIMNMLGQQTSPPATLLEERGDASIDVSKLPDGMYFLQIHPVGYLSNGIKWEGGSVVKKFVKE